MVLEAIELALTDTGYLVVPEPVARAVFPNDVLTTIVRDGMLWLYPMRGPGGGGLMLKRRNAAGDRCVLLTEVLLEIGSTLSAGPLHATWDARHAALCIALP
jgi:hydrogenase maturation protease